MTKALKILALSASFAFAATAAQAETLNFSREGVNYRADVSERADGATVITGTVVSTGERFRLVLQDGQVVGRFGSAEVAFAAPKTETLLSSR